MEKNKEQLKEKKYNSCINDYKVGEKTVCSNEMVVELIAYRNHKDIDVRYEDGYVIEHLSYQSFYQRHCPRPDKKPVLWTIWPHKRMVGRKKRTLNGYRTIIAVNGGLDIDYIDDNGEIVRHGDYAHFRYSNMSIYYNSRKDAEKKRNTAV